MPRFTVPLQRVAHERVEDEVIAINLTTGTYFSLCDSAADVWTMFVDGADVDAAGAALAAAHGLAADSVVADVRAFADALVASGLLVEDAQLESMPVVLDTFVASYVAPRVERYDDMEELLLLDPIHEVDDAGWPVIPVQPR